MLIFTTKPLLIIATLALTLVSACIQSDTKFVNNTSKILNVEPANAAIKHAVAGSVKIISGCSFFVRNMTIIPTGNAAYWYGVPKGNNIELIPRVVASALGSYNGQSVTFNLDPQFSFDEMSILEIRSEGDNRPYGAFSVSGNVTDVTNYYKVSKGAEVDFDPTKPFGSGGSIVYAGVVGLFMSIVIAASFV